MPKISTYFTFVCYYRDTERKKGRQLTIDQAKAEADPIWEKLPPTARAHFEEMAEAQAPFHRPRRARPPPKPVDEFRQKIRACIERDLQSAVDVKTRPFHFISFHKGSSCRLPNELSILKFSIDKGADYFMHYIFNPEVSPNQFKLFCEAADTKLTVVPIEGTPNSEQNLAEVLTSILEFTGGVVYTTSKETPETIECFTNLKAACPGFEIRDIVPLDGEELIQMLWERSRDGHNAQFCKVRETCSNQSGLDHMACGFHRASKNTGTCTLWKPYRLAYGLSEILAKPYDMKVAEGYHRLRKAWKPVGTYFCGKGTYEDWPHERASSGWDSDFPSSSTQAWGADSSSNWA